jgi:hypothetical protein
MLDNNSLKRTPEAAKKSNEASIRRSLAPHRYSSFAARFL